MMLRVLRRWIGLCVCGAVGCASNTASNSPPSTSDLAIVRSAPVQFTYHANSGEPITEQRFRGRTTIVAMVTTYDLGSQILLRRVEEVVRTFKPRINALAVVLEPPSYAILLDTFRESLNLSFPIALADTATRDGRSPFGLFDHVPHLVFLDRQGRPVLRLDGPLSVAELEQALRRVAGS